MSMQNVTPANILHVLKKGDLWSLLSSATPPKLAAHTKAPNNRPRRADVQSATLQQPVQLDPSELREGVISTVHAVCCCSILMINTLKIVRVCLVISRPVIADQLGLAYCGATLQLKGGHHARRFQRLLDPTDRAATAAAAVAAATGDEVPAELSDAELSDDDEDVQEEMEQNGTELVQRYCKHLRQWTQLRYIQLTLWARPRAPRFPVLRCQQVA